MGHVALPYYHMYVRRSDKAMQVVDMRHKVAVEASHIVRAKIGGYFVKMPGRISVLLLDEEVTYCHDFPAASDLKAS